LNLPVRASKIQTTLLKSAFIFSRRLKKYLKAFIIANELQFRPVHNLLELLETCKQIEADVEKLRQACQFLNPFYLDTRYPVRWPTRYDKDTAGKAKQMTDRIRNWVINSTGR